MASLREFGNINLADWLSKQGCQYVLRTKSNKYVRQEDENYQQLLSLGLKPGKSFYLRQVEFTKQSRMTRVNIFNCLSVLDISHTLNHQRQKRLPS